MTAKDKKKSKERLDKLLVERGLAEDESKARSLIMSGVVYSGITPLKKPGDLFPNDIPIELKQKEFPWVSRGGLKLEKALKFFEIDVKGKVCLDVGASTGGFTDVLLHNGAKKVYAVDVGQGQLAWKLQKDQRVIIKDKTNARHLTKEIIPEEIDIIVCDASFIGLEIVLPASLKLAKAGATLVALIKPQFEVRKDQVGKGGIVTDPSLHEEVCQKIKNWLESINWKVMGITESPITGTEGNKEFLIAAQK